VQTLQLAVAFGFFLCDGVEAVGVAGDEQGFLQGEEVDEFFELARFGFD